VYRGLSLYCVVPDYHPLPDKVAALSSGTPFGSLISQKHFSIGQLFVQVKNP